MLSSAITKIIENNLPIESVIQCVDKPRSVHGAVMLGTVGVQDAVAW